MAKLGKLKELKEKAGLTQLEVAIALNVSRPLISKFENGECLPCLNEALKLMQLFNCKLIDIYPSTIYKEE